MDHDYLRFLGLGTMTFFCFGIETLSIFLGFFEDASRPTRISGEPTLRYELVLAIYVLGVVG